MDQSRSKQTRLLLAASQSISVQSAALAQHSWPHLSRDRYAGNTNHTGYATVLGPTQAVRRYWLSGMRVFGRRWHAYGAFHVWDTAQLSLTLRTSGHGRMTAQTRSRTSKSQAPHIRNCISFCAKGVMQQCPTKARDVATRKQEVRATS